ncbi:GNAT family protein [Actinophytocola sp.]|uniref:GNAT family N-acetyltransferase n=1 Tax=Actinophytocola sp. TaxID=1872138 RepID=UPI0025C6F4FB|nr:GNAT family protein [Actinophytocola sp.]
MTESDLDRLEEMFVDPDAIGVFNWGGFTDGTVWRKRFEENRLLSEDRSVLMVELDGTALGFVSWNKIRTGQFSHVFEFGISLWPAHRGKGHGSAAQLQLARYLFAHSTVHRIQAGTELDNIAEQRALEKAGFTREAVLREYSFRDGAWRDEVLYRMLRPELPMP